MHKLSRLVIMSILAVVVLCGQATFAAEEGMWPIDDMLSNLKQHIAELSGNIEKIAHRKDFLGEAPKTKDPIIQKLRKLDLQGWELHQDQWELQHEHLRFVEELLQKVKMNPESKPQLLDKWKSHEQGYEDNLNAYRQQRHVIEEKRIQTEGKLVERYFH